MEIQSEERNSERLTAINKTTFVLLRINAVAHAILCAFLLVMIVLCYLGKIVPDIHTILIMAWYMVYVCCWKILYALSRSKQIKEEIGR